MSGPPIKSPSPAKRLETAKNPPLPATPPQVSDIIRLFSGDDRVLIVISADPDAIASAIALKRLLWRKVAGVAVSRLNQVQRLDNLNLLAYLKLPLVPFNQVDLAKYTKLAMVDSQPAHSQLTRTLDFNLIIDHHPPTLTPAPAAAHARDSAGTRIIDLRPDYGATASIMSEYLRQANIAPNQKLATALFYAIKTDTQNFVRKGLMEDMHAFRWLYPYINQHALLEIDRETLSRKSFRYLASGFQQARFKKNHAYVFMEKVDSPDTLVVMADFLLHVDNISLVLVAGLFKDKVVLIFRGAGRLNVGRLASEVFGPYGSAGGHKTMARGELPLSGLDCRPPAESGRAGLAQAVNRFILKHLGEWQAKRGPREPASAPEKA